jgi:hypothetical protein
VQGTFLGGARVHDLAVGPLAAPANRITVRELVPNTDGLGLFRRGLAGVAAHGVHVTWSLGAVGHTKPHEPMDWLRIRQWFPEARATFLRYGVNASEVTAVIEGARGGSIRLGPSSLHHAAGQQEVALALGEITQNERVLVAAQRTEARWLPSRWEMSSVRLHPQLECQRWTVEIPAQGGLYAECVVRVAEAVFGLSVAPESDSLTLQLREGRWEAESIHAWLGRDLPWDGALTSFALQLSGIVADPATAQGTLSFFVENPRWNEVRARGWAVDATLEANDLRVVSRVETGGAEWRMDTRTVVDRAAMRPRTTTGTWESPSVAALWDGLGRSSVAGAAPAASVRAEAAWDWTDSFQIADVRVAMDLLPEDIQQVAPGHLEALRSGGVWKVGARVDGVEATASIEQGTYDGEVRMKECSTARIAPWLEMIGWTLRGSGVLDAVWRGRGPMSGATGHRGEWALTQGVWTLPNQAPWEAAGVITYAWPDQVAARDVTIRHGGHVIRGDLAMADGWVRMDSLKWTGADGAELAHGSGRLPAPEDPSDWHAFLANDLCPLDLTMETRALRADTLAVWWPALADIDPRTTAQGSLRLTGTCADPQLHVDLDVRGLRVKRHPALPAAAIQLTATGQEGVLQVKGTLQTPGYAPAILSATLPFAPQEWARDRETLRSAALDARVTVPRLDLARFAAMVPGVAGMSGVLRGELRAKGTAGEPQLEGALDLTGGSLHWKHGSVPEARGISARATFQQSVIALPQFQATMAGGMLKASGEYDVQKRTLDARVRGQALPLFRNDSMILRADLELRAQGTPELSAVRGSVALVDSLFYRDVEVLPIGTPFSMPKAALPRIDLAPPTAALPESFARWPLDLVVTTADPFLIRGNLATGSIAAHVRVGGTVADPRPDGRIRLQDARAVLPFTTLMVPDATLTFTPAHGFDPVIEVRGTAEPRPYQVTLYAYGRASDPQIILSSVPPLPQNEIMTLIATGTTTRGLENTQIASARALQLLGEEIRRGRAPVGNELRPLLGLLDRVDFTLAESDPYSSDTFSTATLKLHERWYLSAGMGQEGNARLFGIWRLRFR